MNHAVIKNHAVDRCALTFIALLAANVFLAATASADTARELYEPYALLLADFVVEHDLDRDGLVSSSVFPALSAISPALPPA
ncbi:MAG: hypothetical protein ABR550_11910, partial [Wenzhouxiangellaceae bacterium]